MPAALGPDVGIFMREYVKQGPRCFHYPEDHLYTGHHYVHGS